MASLGDRARFLIDSGAFQAFKLGKAITVDGYCAYLRALPITPWGYFSLDVIGDPIASERNYQIMLDRGFTPIPVFTRGDDLPSLDRMFETAKLVALGGLVSSHSRPHGYLKAVMEYVAGRPVHLLGFTDASWIKYLKPYSVDSSSWARAARFGRIDVYLGDGRMVPLVRNQVASAVPPEPIIRAIIGMGFDPYALGNWASWSRSHSLTRWISAASWLRYTLDLERATGTLLFLAISPGDHITLEPCLRSILDGGNAEESRLRVRAQYEQSSRFTPSTKTRKSRSR